MSKKRLVQKGTKLTDEQTQKMSDELNILNKQVHNQMVEHRMYLVGLINGVSDTEWMTVVPDGVDWQLYRNIILQDVHSVKIASAKLESNIKDRHGNPTVSTVYEYPDALYVFLTHEKSPAAIKKVLAGGIHIDEKSTTTVEPVKVG